MITEEDISKIFKEYLFDNVHFTLQNPVPISREDKKILESISSTIKKEFPTKNYEPGLIIYGLLNKNIQEGNQLNKTIKLKKLEINFSFCQRLAKSDSKFACSFKRLEEKHGVCLSDSEDTKEVVIQETANDSKPNGAPSLKKRDISEDKGKSRVEEEITRLKREIDDCELDDINDLLETTDEEKIIQQKRSKSVVPRVRFNEETDDKVDRRKRRRSSERRSVDRNEYDRRGRHLSYKDDEKAYDKKTNRKRERSNERRTMEMNEYERRERQNYTDKDKDDKETDEKETKRKREKSNERRSMDKNEYDRRGRQKNTEEDIEDEEEDRNRRQKQMERAREEMEQTLRRHLGSDLRLISNFIYRYQHLTSAPDIAKYLRIKGAIFRIRDDLHDNYY